MGETKNLRFLIRENVFTHIAISISVGILFAEKFGILPWGVWIAIILVGEAVYTAWLCGKESSSYHRILFFILLNVCIATGALRFWNFENNIKPIPPNTTQTFYAKVEGSVKMSRKTLQTDIILQNGSKIRASLMLHNGEPPGSGDILLLHGEISAPRNNGNPGETDYADYLLKHGYSGTIFCYANSWRETGREHLTLKDRMARLRENLTQRFDTYFKGRDMAVLSALTLGDKSLLNPEIREVFSETGTSHILALSGLHLGILLSLYNLLLTRVIIPQTYRRKRRVIEITGFVLGLAMTWLYTLLAGMPISLIRAAVMYSMVQCAVVMQRDVFSINNLCLAAIIILIVSPEALFDISFQLSFLSVLGIFLLMPLFPKLKVQTTGYIKRKLYGCIKAIWGMLCVSISATAFTLPLVAYTFHVVPLWGWAASLVAIPLTALILATSPLFFLVPCASSLIATAIGLFLNAMFACLEAIASMPYSSLSLYPTLLSVLMMYGVLICARALILNSKALNADTLPSNRTTPVGQNKSKTRGNTFLVVALMCLLAGIVFTETRDSWRTRLKPQIVFYNTPPVPAIHLIASADSSYLWTTMPQKIDTALLRIEKTFWKRHKIKSPTLLVSPSIGKSFAYFPHVIDFGGCRIGLLYEPIDTDATVPLQVDYVFVARGWKRSLSEAFHVFQTDSVVLDGSLSNFYRRRFRAEADSIGVGVRDLRKDGAWIVCLE